MARQIPDRSHVLEGCFVIRTYEPGDLPTIVKMVTGDDRVSPDLIQERMEKWLSLVWDDGSTVRGVACYNREAPREFNVRIYVDPAFRRTGIGGALYTAAMPLIEALGHGRVTARYRADSGDGRGFFLRRGFTYWYSMDMLRYDGPRMPVAYPTADTEIHQYEDRYFDEFMRIMAESFLPQRRFFDFRPHDVREIHGGGDGRKRVLENRDNMFVALEGGKLVAIAELEGGFIDTLGVDAHARGRGFGRALMQHCVNVLLGRDVRGVETSVVLGNMPAWRLYNTLGFRRVQIDEWACLFI